VLVSNAGICQFLRLLDHAIGSLGTDTKRQFGWIVLHYTRYEQQLCVISLIAKIVEAVARQMKEQAPQGGSIIGISSISALAGGSQQVYVPDSVSGTFYLLLFPTLSHYTPTKAGILSLMQSTAVALGKYNIRANAILPGTIATDINKEDLSDTMNGSVWSIESRWADWGVSVIHLHL